MSLRERLEAKARRRVVWTVQVSDPDLAQAAAAAASAERQAGGAVGVSEGAARALDEVVADTRDQVASHFERVEFEALAPEDFEALLAAHVDEHGDVDRPAMRAALAGACAVDEDLRDADWWAEQLASGRWSKGEVDDLYHLLFTVLNYSVPRGGYSKG